MIVGETHDFVESSAAILAADGIALIVANMVIGSNEDTDGIRNCGRCQFYPPSLGVE